MGDALPDIFLSYNREDQKTARRFAEAFLAEGLEVWWDVTLRSGEAYDEVTETALRTAKAVVVLWSVRSAASRWVRAEATLADRNKTLVPVMIEPCERPIMFELTQTADLTHWTGDRADPSWGEFLTDVRRFVDREAKVRPAPAPPAVPKPKTAGRRGAAPSIAVLPFTNRSGVAEDEIFAFGMVEDIIDAMSQGVEVRVVSSSATARFRTGGITDLAALARELRVRYVLEGNVRRVGEDLRVTTQLVEADTGNILWTQNFDRPLAQLGQLQEELVLEVAAHLRTQSHRQEIERALRKPGDLTAWEAVMRSVAAYRRLTGPALMMGLEEARKAMEIAPDYGVAVALHAQAQAILYNQLMPDDAATAQRIRAQAQKAIALDPDNSTVLSTAAGALSAAGFPKEGLAAGQRAIQLNRYNEFAYFACGMSASLLSMTEEALAYFDQGYRLAPDNPTTWISYMWRGGVLGREERWKEAAKAYDKALRLTPDNAAPNIGLAVCLRALGRHDEARAVAQLARGHEPDTPLAIWELRFGRTNAGSPTFETFMTHLRSVWAETGPTEAVH